MKQTRENSNSEIAIIGAGVIGAGWSARFLINGYNVALFDPDIRAQNECSRVIKNAERAMELLTIVNRPEKGSLRIAKNMQDALKNASWIQESVPENETLKVKVLNEIDDSAGSDTIIASSTSGLLPSRLQSGMKNPQRLIVAHPFNPVYLLPLVEIVAGAKTTKYNIARAKKFYLECGMMPLVVRKEIDAFIADRLLEALWREAIWLVQDQVASTEEIDNAIRYGFGLRWAQMGVFETYRIAGGKGGFKHFLEHFAPSLQMPWSKLTDVPKWTKSLQKRILMQSDSQAKGRTSQQLELIRDKNLAAIINALKAQAWGAGENLLAYEKILANRALEQTSCKNKNANISASAMPLLECRVDETWLDANAHMNESRYLQVFSNATDRFLENQGFNQKIFERGYTFYTLETNIRHLHEAKAAQKIFVKTRLLACNEKRLHILHQMYRKNTESDAENNAENSAEIMLATAEHILINVLRSKGGVASAPIDKNIAKNLQKILQQHSLLPELEFEPRLSLAHGKKT